VWNGDGSRLRVVLVPIVREHGAVDRVALGRRELRLFERGIAVVVEDWCSFAQEAVRVGNATASDPTLPATRAARAACSPS
jgi:hypothetical protein